MTDSGGGGNLIGAVAEAAFMTGMERNSEVVEAGSYAPLFVNVNNKPWPTNLIVFDSQRHYVIPSYPCSPCLPPTSAPITHAPASRWQPSRCG